MLTTHVILSIIPVLDKHLVIANTLFYLLAAKGFSLLTQDQTARVLVLSALNYHSQTILTFLHISLSISDSMKIGSCIPVFLCFFASAFI